MGKCPFYPFFADDSRTSEQPRVIGKTLENQTVKAMLRQYPAER